MAMNQLFETLKALGRNAVPLRVLCLTLTVVRICSLLLDPQFRDALELAVKSTTLRSLATGAQPQEHRQSKEMFLAWNEIKKRLDCSISYFQCQEEYCRTVVILMKMSMTEDMDATHEGAEKSGNTIDYIDPIDFERSVHKKSLPERPDAICHIRRLCCSKYSDLQGSSVPRIF